MDRLTGWSEKGETELGRCSLTCHLLPLVRSEEAQEWIEEQESSRDGDTFSFPGVKMVLQHGLRFMPQDCLEEGRNSQPA